MHQNQLHVYLENPCVRVCAVETDSVRKKIVVEEFLIVLILTDRLWWRFVFILILFSFRSLICAFCGPLENTRIKANESQQSRTRKKEGEKRKRERKERRRKREVKRGTERYQARENVYGLFRFHRRSSPSSSSSSLVLRACAYRVFHSAL